MEPFGVNEIISVETTPVAAAEFTDPAVTAWQAVLAIEPAYSVNVPLAITCAARPVPTAAGSRSVVLPSAPVTAESFTVPLVALPNASVPGVPDPPRVGVAVQGAADVLVPFGTPPTTTVFEIVAAFVCASLVTLLRPTRVELNAPASWISPALEAAETA